VYVNCQLNRYDQHESTDRISDRCVYRNFSIDHVREADGKGIITVTTLVYAT
jgi:hypothetical protein